MSQINKVNIPNFEEFSVKNVYNKITNNNILMPYFPELRKSRMIDKRNFYDVLSTLYPEYVADMIHAAYAKRSGGKTAPKEETIQITPHLLSMIKDASFVSSSDI